MSNTSLLSKPVEEALHRAAAGALTRIESDRRKAPDEIEPLLRTLAGRLFDHDLNVSSLLEACDIRDQTRLTVFKKVTGRSVARYVELLRLETAKRLLEETSFNVDWIGELLGFGSNSAFTRAFKRSFGRAPSVYRRLATAPRDESQGETSGSRTLEICKMAITGRVQAYQTWCLIEHLTSGKADDWLSLSDAEHGQVDLHTFEEIKALGVWDAIRDLEEEEKKKYLQIDLGFRTPALFDLLLEKGRELGAEDARAGVELTELAIRSLDPLSGSLPEAQLHSLAARGWRSLSRELRRARAFDEAERALAIAREAEEHQPVQK